MKIHKLNRHNFSFGIALIIVLFLAACKTEKDKIPNAYEDFFSKVYSQGQFNGNVLILENGNIAFQGYYGISNIDPIDSMHLNSIFRLGSVSKQFTAMGIMILKESGILSYDQNIRDFIPELPYEGVTVRHLLNHVSGLPDYTRLMDENWKADLNYDDPDRFISGNIDIINMLAEKKPDIRFYPGEKWEYSNTGYVLLASIVQRASGLPFEQFLKKQIFDPVKMTNTSVYNYVPGKDERMPFRVYGYNVALNGSDLISNDCHYLNPAQGDGGIYSTLGDLMKWDRILYKDELISQDTREEAFTPAILNNRDTTNYGFGWSIGKSLTGKKTVQHGGGWVGFRTYIFREIEENNCIIILTNHSSRYIPGILGELKNILHNRAYSIPPLKIGEIIGQIVMNQGVENAIDQYKKLKSENPEKYEFGENELNALGYQLIELDRIDEAIKIFLLNKEEYPQSANTYDSLGDAFLANGDTTNALINFKNALAIDSTFTTSKEKIENIESGSMANKK